MWIINYDDGSSAGLAVGEYSAVMALTPCMLCVQIYCVLHVVCIGLLSAEFSTVNTGCLCVC